MKIRCEQLFDGVKGKIANLFKNKSSGMMNLLTLRLKNKQIAKNFEKHQA
jgi:hypothetical protein